MLENVILFALDVVTGPYIHCIAPSRSAPSFQFSSSSAAAFSSVPATQVDETEPTPGSFSTFLRSQGARSSGRKEDVTQMKRSSFSSSSMTKRGGKTKTATSTTGRKCHPDRSVPSSDRSQTESEPPPLPILRASPSSPVSGAEEEEECPPLSAVSCSSFHSVQSTVDSRGPPLSVESAATSGRSSSVSTIDTQRRVASLEHGDHHQKAKTGRKSAPKNAVNAREGKGEEDETSRHVKHVVREEKPKDEKEKEEEEEEEEEEWGHFIPFFDESGGPLSCETSREFVSPPPPFSSSSSSSSSSASSSSSSPAPPFSSIGTPAYWKYLSPSSYPPLGPLGDTFIPRHEFCRRVLWRYQVESDQLFLFYPEEISGSQYSRQTLRYTICFQFHLGRHGESSSSGNTRHGEADRPEGFSSCRTADHPIADPAFGATSHASHAEDPHQRKWMTVGPSMVQQFLHAYTTVLTQVAAELRNAERVHRYMYRQLTTERCGSIRSVAARERCTKGSRPRSSAFMPSLRRSLHPSRQDEKEAWVDYPALPHSDGKDEKGKKNGRKRKERERLPKKWRTCPMGTSNRFVSPHDPHRWTPLPVLFDILYRCLTEDTPHSSTPTLRHGASPSVSEERSGRHDGWRHGHRIQKWGPMKPLAQKPPHHPEEKETPDKRHPTGMPCRLVGDANGDAAEGEEEEEEEEEEEVQLAFAFSDSAIPISQHVGFHIRLVPPSPIPFSSTMPPYRHAYEGRGEEEGPPWGVRRPSSPLPLVLRPTPPCHAMSSPDAWEASFSLSPSSSSSAAAHPYHHLQQQWQQHCEASLPSASPRRVQCRRMDLNEVVVPLISPEKAEEDGRGPSDDLLQREVGALADGCRTVADVAFALTFHTRTTLREVWASGRTAAMAWLRERDDAHREETAKECEGTHDPHASLTASAAVRSAWEGESGASHPGGGDRVVLQRWVPLRHWREDGGAPSTRAEQLEVWIQLRLPQEKARQTHASKEGRSRTHRVGKPCQRVGQRGGRQKEKKQVSPRYRPADGHPSPTTMGVVVECVIVPLSPTWQALLSAVEEAVLQREACHWLRRRPPWQASPTWYRTTSQFQDVLADASHPARWELGYYMYWMQYKKQICATAWDVEGNESASSSTSISVELVERIRMEPTTEDVREGNERRTEAKRKGNPKVGEMRSSSHSLTLSHPVAEARPGHMPVTTEAVGATTRTATQDFARPHPCGGTATAERNAASHFAPSSLALCLTPAVTHTPSSASSRTSSSRNTSADGASVSSLYDERSTSMASRKTPNERRRKEPQGTDDPKRRRSPTEMRSGGPPFASALLSPPSSSFPPPPPPLPSTFFSHSIEDTEEEEDSYTSSSGSRGSSRRSSRTASRHGRHSTVEEWHRGSDGSNAREHWGRKAAAAPPNRWDEKKKRKSRKWRHSRRRTSTTASSTPARSPPFSPSVPCDSPTCCSFSSSPSRPWQWKQWDLSAFVVPQLELHIELAAAAALRAISKFHDALSVEMLQGEMREILAFRHCFDNWSTACCQALVEVGLLNHWLEEIKEEDRGV